MIRFIHTGRVRGVERIARRVVKHLVEEVGLFVAQKVLGQAAGD